jgi:Domain of unknown function (DUF4214)
VAQSYFVDQLYEDLLGREPDLPGLNNWVELLQAGVDRGRVAQAVWQSPEHRGLEIDGYYHSLLHRAADPAGRAFWVEAFLAGASETDVQRSFLASTEYTAEHPDAASYLHALYADVLGREADASGLAAGQRALQSGLSRAALAQAFLTSAEAHRNLIDGYYTTYLGRSADASGASAWLRLLENGTASPEAVTEFFLASQEYYAKARAAAR